MFDFRNGMLGVVIITLAIAGSLFGSYLAGIESEDVEVTKYNYLADANLLFDYDQSPQYIEFDPSTNYTGYYSNDSINDVDGKQYFAEDEVGYIPSQSVNNYKLPLSPEYREIDTLGDVFDLSNNRGHDYKVYYVYNEDGSNVRWWGMSDDLKDFIESMTLPDDTDGLRFTLSGITWATSVSNNKIELDGLLFIPKSQFNSNGCYITNPNLNLDIVKDNLGIKTVYKPFQSFEVDFHSWMVKCYMSDDYEGNYVSYSADSIIICMGVTTTLGQDAYMNLSSEFTYRSIDFADPTYLDPNDGVWLKEESP